MELAEGGSLKDYLDKRRKRDLLSEEDVLEVFTQLCEAVRYLHAKKIHHRDLKPANVFLSKRNSLK